MKTIGILLVLCIANISAWLSINEQAELKKFSEECSQEINITIDKVRQALMGETTEDEEKLQCYTECLLHKGKIMDKDGNIDEKVLREKMPKDVPKKEVDAIVKQCVNVDADSGCKKAANFAMCVIKIATIQELSS